MQQPSTVFLDVETTGLDDTRHNVWEIGVIHRDGQQDTEYLWHVRPNMRIADAQALRINRYYERTTTRAPRKDAVNLADGSEPAWSNPYRVASQLAQLLDGATVVGANPDYDYRFLRRFLADRGQAWTARRLVDIRAMAAGWLLAHTGSYPASWRSSEISRAIGVDPDDHERHTALGDARWVRGLWDALHPTVLHA